MLPAVIEQTHKGLYCGSGDFHIDPWKPVRRAVITHAHSDHARPGSESYICAESGVDILRERVGREANIHALPFGTPMDIGKARVSLHPAGHILGSAQIRVDDGEQAWVVSGDYKTGVDPSCEPFEPVACDTFISEATFALPIYRWPDPRHVFAEIHAWWRENQSCGRTSLIFAYALGKAQRILCGLDATIGPIGVHGAVDVFLPHYRKNGRPLPPTLRANADTRDILRGHGLIIAPLSARNTPWMRRFGPCSTAFASGWMRIRGNRRRHALDRGFVISDHADWDGLIQSITATGAKRVGLTHGDGGMLSRWLRENQHLDTFTLDRRDLTAVGSNQA